LYPFNDARPVGVGAAVVEWFKLGALSLLLSTLLTAAIPANPPVSFALDAASECGSPHNPNTLAAYTTGPNVIEPITSMLPSSCTASDPMI